MITYVNVQIGYASGCRFDGLTIEIPPLSGATRRIVLPAAVIAAQAGQLEHAGAVLDRRELEVTLEGVGDVDVRDAAVRLR